MTSSAIVAFLLGLLSTATLAFDPICDTTREQRDALREAVTNRLQETGEFSGNPGVSRFNLNAISADSQGGVFSYFSPPFQGVGPFYQLRQSTDVILNIYCNPPAPGPAYWGTTQFLALPGFIPSIISILTLYRFSAGTISELGDSINQFRLNSTARVNATNPELNAAEDESLLPWEKTSAVITTADADSADAVRSALINADFPEEAINIQVIPSLAISTVSFGTPSLFAGTFATSFRDRAWSDPAQQASYGQYVEPILFYSDASRVPNPFPTPPSIPRGGFESEIPLQPSFDAFVEAVREHYSNQGFSPSGQDVFRGLRPEGGCIENYQVFGCGLGNQDMAYKFGQPSAPSFFGGLHVVLGAIHSLTGLAQYTGIGFGIGETLDAMDLQGSAEALLGPNVSSTIPNIDVFYVFEVRRRCSAEANPNGIVCVGYPFYYPFILFGRYLERAALQKSTTTAPALEDIISPVILEFGQSFWPF